MYLVKIRKRVNRLKTNIIYNEDCLEGMKKIPDGSIDMILCDLPYGTTDCKWDTIIPFEPLWEQYNRIIKDNGAIVLFASQPFTTTLINSNLKHYRYNWYWKKNNITGGQFAKYQPLRCIEDICVFYKKMPTYNPQGIMKLDKPILKKVNKNSFNFKGKNGTLQKYTNYPKHFIEFSKDTNGVHPTQKPVALLEYLIKTYTNEGDVVLDNCMGSGSTCVAAVNTNRHYIGFELDEKYFDIACKRLDEAEGKIADAVL